MIRFNNGPRGSIRCAVALATVSLLAACATRPVDGTTARVEAQKELRIAEMRDVERTTSAVPDWFLKLPDDEMSVYAAGAGRSRDIQIAMDKGLLAAKRSLADRMNSRLNSRTREFTEESGVGGRLTESESFDRTTTNLISEASLVGYRQMDAVVVPEGRSYRAFVLLQYPLDEANALASEAKAKNASSDLDLRATEAFQSLRREVLRKAE